MKFENIFGVLTSKEQEDRLYTILSVFNLIFWILLQSVSILVYIQGAQRPGWFNLNVVKIERLGDFPASLEFFRFLISILY